VMYLTLAAVFSDGLIDVVSLSGAVSDVFDISLSFQ